MSYFKHHTYRVFVKMYAYAHGNVNSYNIRIARGHYLQHTGNELFSIYILY